MFEPGLLGREVGTVKGVVFKGAKIVHGIVGLGKNQGVYVLVR